MPARRPAKKRVSPGVPIGYARVSADEQNLALQLDALKKSGCDRVFTDKASGTRVVRPGLDDALSHLRSGDTLVVWKLDRLGRSVKGLVDVVNVLKAREVHFRSLTDGIDTKTPAGRFFFHIMASLAEMKRELIVERTRAGLAAARKLGRVGGRKRRMTDSKIKAAHRLLAGGTLPRDVPIASAFLCPLSIGGCLHLQGNEPLLKRTTTDVKSLTNAESSKRHRSSGCAR
jgi:DNA invertase Pin-like site-specific DNA recombinase